MEGEESLVPVEGEESLYQWRERSPVEGEESLVYYGTSGRGGVSVSGVSTYIPGMGAVGVELVSMILLVLVTPPTVVLVEPPSVVKL